MLRRLLRHLVLLIAVFGLMPGAERALEQVIELVGHGHFAHTVPGEPDPFAAEHGCTPAEPNGSCGHSQASAMQAKAEAGAFPGDRWLTWMMDSERAGRRPASVRHPLTNDVAPANRSTAPPTPPANA